MLVNSFEGPGLVNWECFVQLHCPLMKTLQILLKNLTRKWQNEVDTTCQGPTDSTVEFQFFQHACLCTSSIPGRDVFVPKNVLVPAFSWCSLLRVRWQNPWRRCEMCIFRGSVWGWTLRPIDHIPVETFEQRPNSGLHYPSILALWGSLSTNQ